MHEMFLTALKVQAIMMHQALSLAEANFRLWHRVMADTKAHGSAVALVVAHRLVTDSRIHGNHSVGLTSYANDNPESRTLH